jgi:hypothetical protein
MNSLQFKDMEFIGRVQYISISESFACRDSDVLQQIGNRYIKQSVILSQKTYPTGISDDEEYQEIEAKINEIESLGCSATSEQIQFAEKLASLIEQYEDDFFPHSGDKKSFKNIKVLFPCIEFQALSKKGSVQGNHHGLFLTQNSNDEYQETAVKIAAVGGSGRRTTVALTQIAKEIESYGWCISSPRKKSITSPRTSMHFLSKSLIFSDIQADTLGCDHFIDERLRCKADGVSLRSTCTLRGSILFNSDLDAVLDGSSKAAGNQPSEMEQRLVLPTRAVQRAMLDVELQLVHCPRLGDKFECHTFEKETGTIDYLDKLVQSCALRGSALLMIWNGDWKLRIFTGTIEAKSFFLPFVTDYRSLVGQKNGTDFSRTVSDAFKSGTLTPSEPFPQKSSAPLPDLEGMIPDESIPTPSAEPQRPRSSGQEYTIQSGDTLSSVAEKHLGDANCWREITKENGQGFTESEARQLQVGQTVSIPSAAPANLPPAIPPGTFPAQGSASYILDNAPEQWREKAVKEGVVDRSTLCKNTKVPGWVVAGGEQMSFVNWTYGEFVIDPVTGKLNQLWFTANKLYWVPSAYVVGSPPSNPSTIQHRPSHSPRKLLESFLLDSISLLNRNFCWRTYIQVNSKNVEFCMSIKSSIAIETLVEWDFYLLKISPEIAVNRRIPHYLARCSLPFCRLESNLRLLSYLWKTNILESISSYFWRMGTLERTASSSLNPKHVKSPDYRSSLVHQNEEGLFMSQMHYPLKISNDEEYRKIEAKISEIESLGASATFEQIQLARQLASLLEEYEDNLLESFLNTCKYEFN